MNKESSIPMITTIIPTYRRPKMLQRAIRSVLNQTYPHFQVCIYDNASGDETAAVVAEIAREDLRVKYHCHSKNIGSIDNFNYGIQQVTTPFFSLLSDDNILLPHFFEDAINTLNHYPKAVFFAGQTIFVNDRGQAVGISLEHWPTGLIYPPEGILRIWENGLPTWESVLFRSKVISSVGQLNPSVCASADQDFMVRVARKHLFYISKNPHALFLYHSSSVTAHRDLIEFVSSNKKILEQCLHDKDLSDAVKERLIRSWKNLVKAGIAVHVYHKCIMGEDLSTIAIATKLMKKEVGLSYKPFRAILIARFVNSNRFLKRILPVIISYFLRVKDRFIFLLTKGKKYIDVKTPE